MDAVYEIQKLTEQKDSAYRERNQLVALLARMAQKLGYSAWRARHREDDSSWEADWRNILFVELPTGQASWHFHDSEAHLLKEFPKGENSWDGHGMAEKYERVNEAFKSRRDEPDTMTFGEALQQIKAGKKVARKGWSKMRVWIALTPGSHSLSHQANKHREGAKDDGGVVSATTVQPRIDMRTADGTLVISWLPNQADMLSEDWVIVE